MVFLKFDVEKDKEIWIDVFNFELNNLSILDSTKLFPYFLDSFVLGFVSCEINVFSPHIHNSYFFEYLWKTTFLDFFTIIVQSWLFDFLIILYLHFSFLLHYFGQNRNIIKLFVDAKNYSETINAGLYQILELLHLQFCIRNCYSNFCKFIFKALSNYRFSTWRLRDNLWK